MKLDYIYPNESPYVDQWKNYELAQDSGRETYNQEDLRRINERTLRKLVVLFIDNPWLSFRDFWNLAKDKINAVLKDFKSPSMSKKEFLQWVLFEGIDRLFQEHLEIKPEFNNLLRDDSDYHLYFHILERDFIFISSSLKNINFNQIRGKCTYKPDIEDPDIKVPKIKVYFPTDDFDLVLDVLEEFLKTHEKLLKLKYDEGLSEILLKQLKRTAFIFRRSKSD
jgi:hypothetical protein